MNKSRFLYTKISQLLAGLGLLTWHCVVFAEDIHSALPSFWFQYRPWLENLQYWLLVLVLGLLGGFFLGKKRSTFNVNKEDSRLFNQSSQREIIEKKLSLSEQRLQRQNVSLSYLSEMQLKDWKDPEQIFREISKVSAETLDVERVSIWFFSDSNQQLECMDLYLKSKNLHTVARSLQANDLPEYFKYISQHRVIAANDIMQHPSTVEFTRGYAQHNNVGAMLDGSIWLNNQVIGAICHEHVGSTREWTLDEQSFAGSVADLARLTIETHRRRKVEADLLEYQRNLESIIKDRTAAIESNAKISNFLVERAPVAILYLNIDYIMIDINPEAEKISGYSREYVKGKTYQELFSSETTPEKNQALRDVVSKGGKVQGEEVLVRRADGSTVQLSVSISVEKDAEGKPFIIVIAQDMTRQKALEASLQKLLESEKRFSYVVNHAPIPIIIINKAGDIIEANPEAADAAGYPLEKIRGKNFIELIVAKESQRKAYSTAARAMQGEDFLGVELTLQNAQGEKYEYECSLGSVMQDNGLGEGQMVAIARNISNQKALEVSLIMAREAAESADRIKSMFVASMSHELRTPLNSIIGFLGVVLQGMSGELNLKQKDQLGRAYHSSKHLLSLITDVIDISKIEAGYLQTHIEKFDLATLLVEVQHATQHLAQEKKLQLIIDCPANIKLETDRKRLYQVVLNVVSNGLKYTEEGTVKVIASKKVKHIEIVVQDTGIGMDEAGLANLFKPFERIESHLKIKTLGTGLGLYLTRKILFQLLGGKISVTSQLAEGSIFTIQVPAKMPTIVAQNHTSILEDAVP